MRITAKLLEAHDACESQVVLFRKTFPRGTKVTLAAIAKARKVGLSVEWIAELLPPSARKAYNEAIAPALVEAFKETP